MSLVLFRSIFYAVQFVATSELLVYFSTMFVVCQGAVHGNCSVIGIWVEANHPQGFVGVSLHLFCYGSLLVC